MTKPKNPELKEFYVERIKKLLPDKKDFEAYLEILKKMPVKSFRCNTLKISPEELKQKLEKQNWKILRPWKDYPEIMIVDEENGKQLEPGEFGRTLEHLLGYYYIQELASMLPVLAIQPEENETILDLCAAPGSKTSQLAAKMKNTGTIFANEISLGRLRILASNLERCGVTNSVLTRKEGTALCRKLKQEKILFDKIIVDAPCSGEGTLRSTPKTYGMWNINTVKQLSSLQKQLFEAAFEILKPEGEMIYSTCTHAPEENEAIVSWALEKFKGKIQIQQTQLPKELQPRQGITEWENQTFNPEVKHVCRIYPHDNNTEGFFISKFKKIRKIQDEI